MANWAINEPAVLAEVARVVGLTISQLADALAALNVMTDPYLIIHGKDATAVFAMGLRVKLGNKQHPVDRLCQMLRLAYDNTIANNTRLFVGVRDWEGKNSPYRILA